MDASQGWRSVAAKLQDLHGVVQQAEQRARELMSAYQGSSNDNLAVSQEFTAAPAVVAEVSDPSLGSGAGAGGTPAYGTAPVSPTHAGIPHTPATQAAPAVAGH